MRIRGWPAPCLAILLHLACCFTLLWACTARASTPTLYECVKVIDGDSVIVRAEELHAPVRLLGIDCPEMNQEWGKAAREFVAARILGKQVRLDFDHPRQDDYDRNLCYLWYEADGAWTCLNIELVRAGLAVPYRKRSSIRLQQDILRARQEAQNAQNGFWTQGGLKLHPREHRRQRRN